MSNRLRVKTVTSTYTPTGTGNACDFCTEGANWVFSTRKPVKFGVMIDGDLRMEDMGTVWRACDECCRLIVNREEDAMTSRSIALVVGPRWAMTEERYAALAMNCIMVVTHFFEAGPDEPGKIAV